MADQTYDYEGDFITVEDTARHNAEHAIDQTYDYDDRAHAIRAYALNAFETLASAGAPRVECMRAALRVAEIAEGLTDPAARFVGYVTAARGSVLVGGVLRHESVAFDNRQQALGWIATVLVINRDAGRRVDSKGVRTIAGGGC